jgi:peptidoglycan/LPS O-acetylase OafA/YrhL
MIGRLYSKYISELGEIPDIVKSSHLPSLNGLRGVAILLVTIGHFFYETSHNILYHIFNGQLGVQVFFVLSGFLITTILIKEKINKKSISLKLFYIRRVLRIFPVAYLYIAFVIILNYAYKLNIPWQGFIGASLYLQDYYLFHKGLYFLHYWTLSVEEQFYLLLPAILKINFVVYILIVPLILVIAHSSQFICNYIQPLKGSILQNITNFILVFDGILVGSFISILVFKNCIPMAFIKKNKIIINILSLLIIYLNHTFGIPILRHMNSFFIGLIIISNLSPSKDFIFKFLNNSILTRVGILSYSLYIWQQPFTISHCGSPYNEIFWFKFPLNIILLPIICYISYYYYERFFLNLKTKFK